MGDVVASAVFKIGRSVGPPCIGRRGRSFPTSRYRFCDGCCVWTRATSHGKCQIQAWDRTAPILPLRSGPAERRSHDYVRHGTSTLFAALEIATGQVTGAL
jgi:hypothetical protein